MKPIFHDNYPQNFYSIVNKQNFAILQAMAGDDASKVECLRPECSSNMSQFEKKKAMWVHLLINALAGGITLAQIPDACNCDELACACEDLVLTGLPIEVTPVTGPEILLTTTGVPANSDIQVLSDTGDLDVATLFAALNLTDAVQGNSTGNFLNFNITSGTDVWSAIIISNIVVNGQSFPLPANLEVTETATNTAYKALIPNLPGLEQVTYSLAFN